MTNAESIKAIIEAAGGTLVNVRFTKKNGEERSLTFNPRDFAEIKGTGAKCQDENIIRIRDIKLKAWRSFDARRVLSVSASGTTTPFTQEES